MNGIGCSAAAEIENAIPGGEQSVEVVPNSFALQASDE
jgi:hypothetical protein